MVARSLVRKGKDGVDVTDVVDGKGEEEGTLRKKKWFSGKLSLGMAGERSLSEQTRKEADMLRV